MNPGGLTRRALVFDTLLLLAAIVFAAWVLTALTEVRELRDDIEQRVSWLSDLTSDAVPETVKNELQEPGNEALLAASAEGSDALRRALRAGNGMDSVRLAQLWGRMNLIALSSIVLAVLTLVLLIAAQRQRFRLTQQTHAQAEQLGRMHTAQNLAADSERSTAHFVATTTHELRSPLTSILGGLSMYDKAPEDQRAPLVALAKRNAERMLAIVNDLLALQSASPDAPLNRDLVSLTDSAQGAADLLAPLAERQQVRIRLIADDVNVRADADRLNQVWVNLLSNAIRESPQGSEVTVEVQQHDDEGIVRITDQGRGVPEDMREKIFEPFVKGAHADGTGLGLPIARAFVQRMGGQLECEPHPNGASFVVRLPLAA